MDRKQLTVTKRVDLRKGLVAEYDGHGVQLWFEKDGHRHSVYFEPEVLVALENFIGTCYGGKVKAS